MHVLIESAKVVILTLQVICPLWSYVSRAWAALVLFQIAILIHVRICFVILVTIISPLVFVHLAVAVPTPECWISWCIPIIMSHPFCPPVNVCHLAHHAVSPLSKSLDAHTNCCCSMNRQERVAQD